MLSKHKEETKTREEEEAQRLSALVVWVVLLQQADVGEGEVALFPFALPLPLAVHIDLGHLYHVPHLPKHSRSHKMVQMMGSPKKLTVWRRDVTAEQQITSGCNSVLERHRMRICHPVCMQSHSDFSIPSEISVHLRFSSHICSSAVKKSVLEAPGSIKCFCRSAKGLNPDAVRTMYES